MRNSSIFKCNVYNQQNNSTENKQQQKLKYIDKINVTYNIRKPTK